MGNESWFSNLWWSAWKGVPENDKAAIGVLAFEVTNLMSKVVHLWHFLSDNEICRLRKEILNSIGMRKLVADDDDDDRIMDLVLNEIMENFGVLSRSVARLGKKCIDPLFRRFEQFVNNPLQNNLEWFGWDYRLRKMERKVKKMERFVAVTMQLSQELEVLAELEQTLRRMHLNPDLSQGKLFEFQQKVMWQRQEVRNLRELSPWIRTYDYIVRLLVRSLLTILQRIKHVFEISQLPTQEKNNGHEYMNPTCVSRSRSFSAMHSSIHPSESIYCGLSSGPLGRSDSKSIVMAEKNKINKQLQLRSQSSTLHGKHHHSRTGRLAPVGPFKECMMSRTESPLLQRCKPYICDSVEFTGDYMKNVSEMENVNKGPLTTCSNQIYYKLALLSSKRGLLNAPPSTLGHAALALHYANMIVMVERLASSPHMIDFETRDDLYMMLPTTIRVALRTRLKPSGKSLAPSVFDASVAAKWSLVLANILEWLSPLAHNMIRWHSERSYEREQLVSRTNVLLVQTLHYANQAKTEAAITELLVGLNYICRINGDISEKDWSESSRCRAQHMKKGRTLYAID
ncbi:uncharacterized protein LOC110620385 [Manihot esculenta]|uniref:DUF668 domain-containing protein n=4 Tax=Manihot esculenta TaxID=3983 RepID=A0A251KA44_MANES|nr:uncharacterized protein LOC110620385 [Manihot esculenta]XP_021619790.1 uncharacterized protein LOC110620385 [Manihot esculenta]XP_021619791.1 uncharacterized protein LOC110620385 [Manihot esculenta]KAG8648636.1 hypothetical protein MANES_08G019600v8 [Manihot esculenta]KAG8648637.1 hypothetical protein MANES_08G019600v8 [Manihot esculenta]KAG8648638.1 hypothetical protein MANES_08G019600v8 [Manihot esculenta]OAY42833.1 hypothetical protein MANES_08G019600v8 [Manihot esculenta]OAY42834.1 hy